MNNIDSQYQALLQDILDKYYLLEQDKFEILD